MDYFSHSKHAGAMLERLAATEPDDPRRHARQRWRGDGASLLRALARSLGELSRRQLAAKRLPGESIGAPWRQSGHSASGQDGTESESRDRDGTENALGRQPPVHDRADGDDAAPGRLDRGGGLARGLAGREDVLDDDDRLARLEREAAPRENAPSLRSTNIPGTRRARAVSCPMTTPPSAGETTAAGENSASFAASSRPAASARSGHMSSRAHWR